MLFFFRIFIFKKLTQLFVLKEKRHEKREKEGEEGKKGKRGRERREERRVPSPGLLTNAWMEARSLELSQVLPRG